MTIPDALLSIPLWAAAGVFVGVIAAKIVRAFSGAEDPENPYDV